MEQVVGIKRNHWSAWIGSSGRNGPDQLVEIIGIRNMSP